MNDGLKPSAHVLIESHPGPAHPYVHTHTLSFFLTFQLPAHTPEGQQQIAKVFEDPVVGRALTAALVPVVGRFAETALAGLLAQHGIVYESSVQRYVTKPEAHG